LTKPRRPMFAMVFSSRSLVFVFAKNLRHYWAAPTLSQEDQSGNPLRGALRKRKNARLLRIARSPHLQADRNVHPVRLYLFVYK
jgi:hypothetical protein